MSRLIGRIRSGIEEIPLYDVHSHISAGQPQAKSIADILFYHFVRRELYSAGLPDDNFLVSEAPLGERMNRFFQYVPFIENTATAWCLRKILADLYRVPGGDLTPQNWPAVQEAIDTHQQDPRWPFEVLNASRLQRSLICESGWERKDLDRHPYLTPLFEDLDRLSFDPTRKTCLIDLVTRSGQAVPETLHDLHSLIRNFFIDQKTHGVRYYTAFISSAFSFETVSDPVIEQIVHRTLSGHRLSPAENNLLVNWLLTVYLETLEELIIPAQFVIGAYWARPGMRYGESYVWTNHQLSLDIMRVCSNFPGLTFSFMCAASPLSQEMTILARMLPNVSLLGFWWHTLYPVYIEHLMTERLEALPVNKWIAIATDAYCVEWAYGKIQLVLDCLTRVLARGVDEGRMTETKALWIARRLIHDNPREIYGLS